MTKRIVAVLLGIVSACCMYAESALPLIHNVMAYEGTSLAGDWNYIVDVQEEGYYDYRAGDSSIMRNRSVQKT